MVKLRLDAKISPNVITKMQVARLHAIANTSERSFGAVSTCICGRLVSQTTPGRPAAPSRYLRSEINNIAIELLK